MSSHNNSKGFTERMGTTDLRVLLITRECLRSDSNEGNTLLNLFAGLPVQLSNIYCKPGLPDNEICSSCFQLTDKMALRAFLKKEPMGQRVEPALAEQADPLKGEQENKRLYDLFRSHNWEILYLAREILWQLAGVESEALAEFVRQAAPDVIVAPMCYSRYVLAVQRFAIKTAGAPAVTYIYDDLYSLRQFRISPLYWLNRFLLRAAIRKTIPFFSFAYTMTEQQAGEYKKYFELPLKVLRKGAPMNSYQAIEHKGVRLIYAGGIYYGRDRTLAKVAQAVRKLRDQGSDAELHIYTTSPLKRKMATQLNDGTASFVHPAVPSEELARRYTESDIALHVESLQKKNALLTRLSFSTKIVDCLASGCAVLAICPAVNAGWQYLKENDAAVCVDREASIESAVRKLILDETMRTCCAEKAARLLRENHDEHQVKQKLYKDLLALTERKK